MGKKAWSDGSSVVGTAVAQLDWQRRGRCERDNGDDDDECRRCQRRCISSVSTTKRCLFRACNDDERCCGRLEATVRPALASADALRPELVPSQAAAADALALRRAARDVCICHHCRRCPMSCLSLLLRAALGASCCTMRAWRRRATTPLYSRNVNVAVHCSTTSTRNLFRHASPPAYFPLLSSCLSSIDIAASF
jgi:hypothetical protein